MTFEIELHREEDPFDPHWLRRPAGRLHSLDEGTGPPVVMVHGNPTWSYYYRHLVQRLSDRYRCIVPDHLGMGRSDKPDDAQYHYTLDARVEDLAALLDASTSGEPVSLVAHDWGGMIALAWAEAHRDRVAKLVLMNTAGFSLPVSSRLPWQLWLVRRLPTAVLVRGLNAFARGAARACSTRPGIMTPARRRAYLAPYDSWAHRIAVERFVQDIPLGPRDPAWATVERVSNALPELTVVPTLIAWGRRDFVFDDAFLAEWRRRVPGAEYLEYDDAGHYVLEDAAEELLPAIDEFLCRPVPDRSPPSSPQGTP